MTVPVTRIRRCPSAHPQFGTRCIHLASTSHRQHSGWHDDVRLEWSDAPIGPRTRDELDATAWAMTDMLGLRVMYDPTCNQIVLDPHSVGEWWDREDRAPLMESWREHGSKT